MSKSTQTNPTDSLIERNRGGRWASAIFSPIIGFCLVYWLLYTVLTAVGLYSEIGHVVGIVSGFLVGIKVVTRSFITNGAVNAFVTVDPLTTLLNQGSALISYGPGTHPCYFWEIRNKGNNISLEAVSETFQGKVQCVDGTLEKKGEFRLRPDITKLPQFLSGVAGAAGNLSGLIEAELVKLISKQKVDDALGMVKEINDHLRLTFVENPSEDVTDLEKRYGIEIDDATLKELLPDEDIQKTKGAITEAAIIAKAVRTFLCDLKGVVDTGDNYQKAIENGLITQKEIADARDAIMVMSKQGISVNKQQFDLNINGLGDLPKDSLAMFLALAKTMGEMGGTKSQPTQPRRNRGSSKT